MIAARRYMRSSAPEEPRASSDLGGFFRELVASKAGTLAGFGSQVHTGYTERLKSLFLNGLWRCSALGSHTLAPRGYAQARIQADFRCQ